MTKEGVPFSCPTCERRSRRRAAQEAERTAAVRNIYHDANLQYLALLLFTLRCVGSCSLTNAAALYRAATSGNT